jgi:NitT/TauT family transport system substrate-binding protein
MESITRTSSILLQLVLGLGLVVVTVQGQYIPPTVELVPMSFQLDWKFNAQFAGIFLAHASGAFADAGVDLEIRPWTDGVNAILDVAEGRADFACAEQNLIIAAQADGAPIKAVATMFQASPYGLMAPMNSNISLSSSSLEDAFMGKAVGVHVDGLKVMALVMGVNGIDSDAINVTEIPYADKWERTASGGFAAVQCYVIDEPIGVAAATGMEPDVMKLSDHGLKSTAQTIVVSDATLAERGELVSAVLAAIFKGWEEALADKPAAAEIVVNDYVLDGSSYKDVAYQTRTLELLEPYVLGTSGDDGPIGVIDPVVWAEAATLMLEYGIVSALPDLDNTLALEYYIPAGEGGTETSTACSSKYVTFPLAFVIVSISWLQFLAY